MVKSHPRISEILLETQGYKDLSEPVILTSGQLGIYYINVEKLAQDGGKFKDIKYSDDSPAMIRHAVEMMEKHLSFREVIDILTDHVYKKLKASEMTIPNEELALSGGQRRDWLISGPIARLLNLPHISLYKQSDGVDKAELIYPNGEVEPVDNPASLKSYYVHHVVDLVTEGSSISKIRGDRELGWLPMLRTRGARIDNLTAVVDRDQGAREMLKEKGVDLTSFVLIDNDFLRTHSKYPHRALEYKADPEEWSKAYLAENGALAVLNTFDPAAGKQDRTGAFLTRYKDVLVETGKFNELAEAVKTTYGVEI